jgi:endonuclease-8
VPEGHTIHRLAREHKQLFGGQRLRVSSPQGRFAESAAVLDGRALEETDAHGKHLFLGFAGEHWVHVHLGLYGGFTGGPLPEPSPRGQVRLRLTGDRAYSDLRGPTACELLGPAEKAAISARLGPDPLRADADPDRAAARVLRSATPIGALLMDQTVVSGVGNVYRAEVLFRQGIAPQRAGRELSAPQWRAIWDDLCALMREGVRTGRIDTVRPEHTPEAMGRPPRQDDHGGEVYVYRRAEAPCLVCRTPVARAELAGRNLFWCPRCQPAGRRRRGTGGRGQKVKVANG